MLKNLCLWAGSHKLYYFICGITITLLTAGGASGQMATPGADTFRLNLIDVENAAEAVPRFKLALNQLVFEAEELVPQRALDRIERVFTWRIATQATATAYVGVPSLQAGLRAADVLGALGPFGRNIALTAWGASWTSVSTQLARKKAAGQILFLSEETRSREELVQQAGGVFQLDKAKEKELRKMLEERNPKSHVDIFILAKWMNEKRDAEGRPLLSDDRYVAIRNVESRIRKAEAEFESSISKNFEFFLHEFDPQKQLHEMILAIKAVLQELKIQLGNPKISQATKKRIKELHERGQSFLRKEKKKLEE